jgi:restriction endonuclease S subunit
MPKVSTRSLRSLASKVKPSILTGAITESADYIDELEKKIQLLESSLKIYKEENDTYEKSTHIEEFLYEFNVNENGEIPCLIKANGVEHSFGITEKDARGFLHLFQMHKNE